MTPHGGDVDPGCGADSRRVAATPETLDSLDRRRSPFRRYQAIASQIAVDLGGNEALSEQERQIIDRASFLAMQLEREEAKALAGHQVNLAEFGALADRMRRLLEAVGLKRVPRTIVPSLGEYLSDRAKQKKDGALLDLTPADTDTEAAPVALDDDRMMVYLTPRATAAVAGGKP